jgi:CubicO group peptidase (beta-lactamase class C family)
MRNFFETQLAQGVKDSLFPGCGIGYSNANGDWITEYSKTFIPESRDKKMYSDLTLFDIASLTKPIVGLPVLKLIDQGELSLGVKINSFLRSKESSWDSIDIKSLLTNSLELDVNQKLHFLFPDQVKKIILDSKVSAINDGYYYHNTTSVILGWLLEEIYNQPIKEIIYNEVFLPAKMKNSFFSIDVPKKLVEDIAPSEICSLRGLVKGKPHDELAYMYEEYKLNVGCAGIFSTVPDMLLFGNYLINGAFQNNETMLSMILTNYLEPFGRTFGLCFDKPSQKYVCPCFAKTSLVATGFTGCSMWIQPDHRRVLVILSNAIYPTRGARGEKSPLYDFRKTIANGVFTCKHCNA